MAKEQSGSDTVLGTKIAKAISKIENLKIENSRTKIRRAVLRGDFGGPRTGREGRGVPVGSPTKGRTSHGAAAQDALTNHARARREPAGCRRPEGKPVPLFD